MYINKFSTGTILALLALSGMLFLVPIAVPVHAAPNASLPTLKTTPTLVLQETPTGLTEAVTNPATNAYAIQTVTLIAPTGWNFTTSANVALTISSTSTFCSSALYGFTTVAVSLTAIECGTGSLPPGFTATFTGSVDIQGPSSPATAAPVTGLFTTSVSDASASGAYPGPSWTETSIAGSGTLVSPAHTGEVAPTVTVTGNTASYTAGGAAQTVTATLTAPTQVGVPVTFSAASGSYPTTGFTTTFSPSSSTTTSSGVVTSSWQPSNHAGDNTAVKATITGTAFSGTGSVVTTTAAAAPTSVTFYLGGSPNVFPTTDYVTTSVVIGSTTYANIASGVTLTATDAFGNPAGAAVTGGTLAAASGFLAGVTTETSCTITAVVTSPTGCQYDTATNTGAVPQYSQSGVYAAIGQMSATLTGTGFSVSGTTGFIQTSTFASAASFTWPTLASPVAAGTSVDYKVQLTGSSQSGVPVVIQVCVHSTCAATSKGYTGTFTNGLSSINGVTNSSGSFGANFAISTALGASLVMNSTVTKPQNAGAQSFFGSDSETVTTGPGVAASLAVYAVFGNGQGAGNSGPALKAATAGATLYVDAILTDAYGNVVTNTSPQQIQVNLAASGVSGGGLLSVTTAYISSGAQSTNNTAQGSFGPVAWTLSTTLGASTVTASAVVAGKAVSGSTTVTTISPLPTINVKSPTPVSGVIYSASPFVTFSGKANASVGYPAPFVGSGSSYPAAVKIVSIGYKVNSGHWISSSVAAGNQIIWSVPVTLGQGLSTIAFNATDSKGNVGIPTIATYQVLVDSVAPTFAFAGTTTATGCEAVTITTGAGDFNTTSFTATYNGVAIPAANIAWAGTQTLGTAGTLTATVCGLTAGTGTLKVTGSSFEKVSGTASETLTVTVTLADSVTFASSSATWGTSGAATGVFVSVTNSWGSAQQLTIYATLKSGSSIYVLVGGETLTAGQTGTVFLQDFLTTVPAGTYTVTFSAITTANQAVSAPTTSTTVTVP
jgi:hypothetical protein